jgi:phenylalanyl-tRNA synthetase alpha chain
LEKGKLPVKIITCGRVYRNEAEDASHQSMFHQYDLVWVEEGISLSHLMALTQHILRGLYGSERKIRFVPKYYPYTEPSIGPQINCLFCQEKGCPACKGSGWVTVGGAGMIHENVLREFNYDPKKVSGMAFGLGTSRLAAQMFHFPNLKSLYVNDIRVLRRLP